ncbi:LuxR family transcriptional regulator [Streptomyces sp. B93]|uniref:helix-turn-helix transcriptional regulator n=1 Tax=Streptomyces sp. B93 TaxID=2824875 RepID=UPI001B393F91|nr:LuxR family transcriptional regulator [Streptomyces sp. B93]MBQ1090093.1 AAA family ATPase [Streptomyces sp. B93]
MDTISVQHSRSLIGRQDERDFIRRFFTEASVKGGALVVTGEPGIGKSALLDATAQDAEHLGCAVLRVAGVQFEADIGYSGLNQLVVPLLPYLDKLDKAHRDALRVATGMGSGTAPDRLLVSTATLLLLRRVAEEAPVLLAVDDVPWLDRSTAVVLGFVARRLIGSRIGFLATARTGSDGYFERGGLPEHVLEPLGDESAHELLRTVHPRLASSVRRRIVAEARGNPLALVELPAVLSGPQQQAEAGMPSVLPLNERLKGLFAERVAELPARCRHALLLAALDGTGDLSVIEEGVGASFVDDLGPAERARVVTVDLASYRLAFGHPLLASAVVESATSGERREAHRTLADALTAHPERRAWHLGEAASSADEEVAGLLEAAAQRILARGDATGAVAALSRAARLSPLPRDRSRRLAEAAYIGADAGGELRSASVLLDSARRADPALSGSLLAAAATAHLLINTDGDVDTAHSLVTGAVEAHLSSPEPNDDFALGEALHTLLLLCWYGGRAELWDPLFEAMEQMGDAVPELLWLTSRTFGDAARTGPVALERLDRVLERASAETDPTRVIRIGTASVYPDRLSDLREASWRVIRQGRRGESPARRHLGALMHLCVEHLFTGRWDEVDGFAAEGLRICEEQEFNFFVWYFRYCQAFTAAARGQADTSRVLTEQIKQWAAPRGAHGAALWATQARALCALGSGDFEEAYRQSCLLSPPGELAPFVPHALWNALDLVESANRTGRIDEARSHARAVRDSAMSALSPRLRVQVRVIEAMTSFGTEAEQHFEAALADDQARRWPFEYARAELLYGEYLRRARNTTQARSHLSSALAAFRGLGAVPWANRAATELRAAGESLPQETRDDSSAPLTPQELQIATLAATGLTNKQIGERLFLSHRTVGSHLYQIYPKLGITTRAALRDALAALGEAPADI